MTTTDQRRLAWGRPVPADADLAWGGRLILYAASERDLDGKPAVDYLPDRIDHWAKAPPTKEEHAEFLDWVSDAIKTSVLPDLATDPEGGGSLVVHTVDRGDGKYHLEASCQGSCGYLYVGAWRTP